MNIADSLRDISVADLDLSRYVSVGPESSAADTVRTMNSAARSCAFVVVEGALLGIFTQRDVVVKVIGVEGACETAVNELMTQHPRSISSDTSVADALAVMTDLWVRSLPVVDQEQVVGNFSYYTAMKVVADLLSNKASATESHLAVQHGLMFVDFTGLHTEPPVTVFPGDTLEAVVQQMRTRGIGSVLVVNDREALVGLLTEFDLQTKVACSVPDHREIPVEQVMAPHPVALEARAPIAEAVAGMARHEISHVALVGETGRPVGMATFQDVADYFETSLETLG